MLRAGSGRHLAEEGAQSLGRRGWVLRHIWPRRVFGGGGCSGGWPMRMLGHLAETVAWARRLAEAGTLARRLAEAGARALGRGGSGILPRLWLLAQAGAQTLARRATYVLLLPCALRGFAPRLGAAYVRTYVTYINSNCSYVSPLVLRRARLSPRSFAEVSRYVYDPRSFE